ncbi:MAG: hypothetical protein C0445_07005 [Polaromonas sp.]|nr:hypothetical protein [Polaromonas sp.]
MILRSLASVADQVMLSGLNFAIGVFLIRLAPKEVYGAYVQLFAMGLLICGFIDALVTNAVANLSSRNTGVALEKLLAQAQRLARSTGVVLGAVFALAGAYIQPEGISALDAVLGAFGFGVYIVSLTFRDFKRSTLYLLRRPVDVLRLDGGYFVVAALGGVALYVLDHFSVFLIFSVLTLANALALLATANVSVERADAGLAAVWRTLREHWGITRWAVPGVLVGWLGNSIYLYLTGAMLGLAATAELNAARLLLMPVGLITVAWFQMARADIARLVGDNDRRKMRVFLAKSLALIFTPILGYFGVLALGYDWVVLLLSADKYGGLQGLTFVWGVYFSVYTVKFIAVGLLVGFEAYRPMLLVSVVSLCLQSGLLLWLPAVYGMPAVVWCLVASESLETAILWGYLLPKSMKKMNVVRA